MNTNYHYNLFIKESKNLINKKTPQLIKYDDQIAAILKDKMSIYFYTGVMFSGKTSMLIDEYKKIVSDQKQTIILVNHVKDNRYDVDNVIVSHSGLKQNSKKVSDLFQLFNLSYSLTSIFIDEGQFFDNIDIFSIALFVINPSINIHISGLEKKVDNTFFQSMQLIKNLAQNVVILQTKCQKCNKMATNTVFKNQELLKTMLEKNPNQVSQSNQEMIGSANKYAVLCQQHYELFLSNKLSLQ